MASDRIFPFLRTEPEIEALRACCALWTEGTERFWAFDDVLRALSRSGSLGFFAANAPGDRVWDGVILADVGPFSADLLYVFVMPAARRKGIGALLVEKVTTELAKRPQLEAMFLEVRASNTNAQALYKRLGMEEVGRRRAYYADGEDALVLRHLLPGKGS